MLLLISNYKILNKEFDQINFIKNFFEIKISIQGDQNNACLSEFLKNNNYLNEAQEINNLSQNSRSTWNGNSYSPVTKFGFNSYEF